MKVICGHCGNATVSVDDGLKGCVKNAIEFECDERKRENNSMIRLFLIIISGMGEFFVL